MLMMLDTTAKQNPQKIVTKRLNICILLCPSLFLLLVFHLALLFVHLDGDDCESVGVQQHVPSLLSRWQFK